MKFLLVVFTLLLLTVCQAQYVSGTIIGNKEIIHEISRLQLAALDRNLTSGDYTILKGLTKDDVNAQDQFREIDWLIAHGEEGHAAHGLAFLEEYVRTGEKTNCLPHELSHIKLYLTHQDILMANGAIKELESESWIQHAEQIKIKFPQYYKNFEETKAKVRDAVRRLQKAHYSSFTLEEIRYVEENASC